MIHDDTPIIKNIFLGDYYPFTSYFDDRYVTPYVNPGARQQELGCHLATTEGTGQQSLKW